MRVLFEDDRVLVVDKPAGTLVIPGRGKGDSLREEIERRTSGRIHVVHRLDREASGIVLFAKDAQAHRSLSLAFEKRKVEKGYLALVLGRLEGDATIRRPIREFGSGRMGVGPAGKPSETRVHVRRSLPGATLVEVEPVTGRRHQIRVHLHSIGHPVLGDPLYGAPPRPVGGSARLLLHAWRLRFPHPAGGVKEILCEPPPDFETVLRTASGRSDDSD